MSYVRTEGSVSSIADAMTRAVRAGERIAEDRARLLSLEFRSEAQRLLMSVILIHLVLWAGIGGILAVAAGAFAHLVPKASPALILTGTGVAQLLIAGILLTLFIRRRT